MGNKSANDPGIRGWLLNTFALGRANYWFTFVADSCTALFFLAWELDRGLSPTLTLAACVAGYLLWGFTEYAFHRWIYHQPEGIFGEGHRIHHSEAETLIAMPWFMTTATMFTLWYAVSVRFGVRGFASLAGGWLAGFVWYSLVHHSHHHWNIRAGWARRLKAYHRVHHQIPDRNYGVTMRFWDVVFGTRHRKPASPSAVEGSGAVETVPAATSRDYAMRR
jgi:sterol desaturase/sphingolipid hydroxylase (fatty acid hydroxylase superfamily)